MTFQHPLLVTPAELDARLSDPKLLIFDARFDLMDHSYGRRRYAENHIPGAVYIDLEADLAAAKTGNNGRHPLPTPDEQAQRLARLGVDADRTIVVYDDAGHNFSVRTWWALRWLGHPAVRLLDGGYPRWVQEGHELSAVPTIPIATAWHGAPDLAATVDLAFVEAFHDDASVQLLDARTAERFRGEQEPIDPVAGHIPGARNRWFKMNLNADGTFKSPSELNAEFSAIIGARDPRQVIHQCGSGVTACHNLFAMELAGLHGSRLYPGSWSEWCAHPHLRVAQGA
jgi:thiosulfate/3-mercaptopyruvate sulfurtransferase